MATIVSPLVPTVGDQRYTDSKDKSPLVKMHEGTKETLLAMLSQERTAYPTSTGCCFCDSSSDGLDERVTEAWRRRICEWIFEVVDHFSFEREVVWITLQYLDRSTSRINETSAKGISRKEFQLLAIASLYLAIKLHGESDARAGVRLKVKVSAFEELSRGLFTTEAIEATERRIFQILDWRLNPPTPAYYLNCFMRFLPRWSSPPGAADLEEFATELFDVAKYFTELSCFNVDLAVRTEPSIVAYGSLICALEVMAAKVPYSMHLHYSFLQDIARVTPAWSQSNSNVIRVGMILRTISPESFDQAMAADSSTGLSVSSSCEGEQGGSRASPTCVCDEMAYSTPSTKKRPSTDITPDHP